MSDRTTVRPGPSLYDSLLPGDDQPIDKAETRHDSRSERVLHDSHLRIYDLPLVLPRIGRTDVGGEVDEQDLGPAGSWAGDRCEAVPEVPMNDLIRRRGHPILQEAE